MATVDFNRLYVFGDSFSDTGAGGGAPGTDFGVRTDGGTAASYLAESFGNPVALPDDLAVGGGSQSSINFAVSGARVGSPGRDGQPSLQDQVGQFSGLVGSGTASFDSMDTLFFLAGGLNDRAITGSRRGNNREMTPVEDIIASYTTQVEDLVELGARYIQLALLPAAIPAFTEIATTLNPVYDTLVTTLDEFYDNVSITVSPWGRYFDDIIENPDDYGMVNVTDPYLGESDPEGARDEYFYYYSAHPSDAAHAKVGDRLFADAQTIAEVIPSDAPTEPEQPTEPEEPTEPEQPTEPEEPTEPEQPADPDRKIVGGGGGDTMTGGSGDDEFVLRFGNDTATGGAGADEFIIDWRYRDAGDAHTLTDLNFEDGDEIAVRFFDGRPITVDSAAGLEGFVARADVTAETVGDALHLTLDDGTGGTLGLTLNGLADGAPSEPTAPEQPTEPEEPTAPEQPTEPDAPADPDRKIVGGGGDDTMTGGNGDDEFVLRFGNDTATGGAGADEFIIDWRYRDAGDAHTLTDLNFEDGDEIAVRFFDGRPITVDSAAGLEGFVARADVTAETVGDALHLTLDDGTGGTLGLTLNGFDEFQFV